MRRTLKIVGWAALLGETVVLAVASEFQPLPARPKDKASAPLTFGLNLSGVTYYGSELPFADLFKMSEWVSQAPGKPWGQGGPLDLDARGWVQKLGAGGQQAQAMFCSDAYDYFAGQKITCVFDGEGDVDFIGSSRTIGRAPGRVTFEMREKGGIRLVIKRTNPDDPVRNIRVMQPGLESAKGTFSPAFLKRWAPFKVLRFMDWQSTNNSPLVEWADRPTPDSHSQATPKGVCLEHMIELANVQGADPWFCMPHLASDDFVRQFAAMVKKQLKPSLKVYLEYSNECWNGIFKQARYCQEQGTKLGLSQNKFEARLRYQSQRAVEVFKIWEREFGGTKRLVRVLAVDGNLSWAGVTVLGWKDAYKNADAVAIAPYFGYEFGTPESANKTAAMSVAQLLDKCRKSIQLVSRGTQIYAAEAKKRGLRLIAYEGGQSLVGVNGAENKAQLTALFEAANRAPAMKDVYLEDLKTWQECGGGLFCLFNSMGHYSKWGSWGLLESEKQNPATAPKYQAVQELLIERSRHVKAGSAS
jgi:hypothetical protein